MAYKWGVILTTYKWVFPKIGGIPKMDGLLMENPIL